MQIHKPFGITIADMEIRSAVLRRMIPNGAHMSPERRKEVFARYVESHDADVRMMTWSENCRATEYQPAERIECDAYARDPDFKA